MNTPKPKEQKDPKEEINRMLNEHADKIQKAAKLYSQVVHPGNMSGPHFDAFLQHLGLKSQQSPPVTVTGGGSGFPPMS
jgi:hypothetical protein